MTDCKNRYNIGKIGNPMKRINVKIALKKILIDIERSLIFR